MLLKKHIISFILPCIALISAAPQSQAGLCIPGKNYGCSKCVKKRIYASSTRFYRYVFIPINTPECNRTREKIQENFGIQSKDKDPPSVRQLMIELREMQDDKKLTPRVDPELIPKEPSKSKRRSVKQPTGSDSIGK